MRSKEIVLYCESENQNTFDLDDYASSYRFTRNFASWHYMHRKANFRNLEERGSCKLQTLSAITGLSPTSLRRDHEIYLLTKKLHAN